MLILRDLLQPLQSLFPSTDNGRERSAWFASTLVAVLIPPNLCADLKPAAHLGEPVWPIDTPGPLLQFHGLPEVTVAAVLALLVAAHFRSVD